MKKIALLLILASITLSGCCSHTRNVQVPPTGTGENISHVTIIRGSNPVGSASPYWATFDGTDVAKLNLNTHTTFSIVPGNHTVGIRQHIGSLLGWHHAEISLVAQKGETYFFFLSPQLFGYPEIEPIGNEKGRKKIEKSEPILAGTAPN